MPEHLTRLLLSAYAPADDGTADADLLARVDATRDAVAFELLVRRHAGLVWRACRAVARDHHAAEDAFQATFLALARRAGGVRDRSAAGWLYRVACRAALKARPRGGLAPVPPDLPSPLPGPPALAEHTELAALAHAELSRLPDRYRTAVVLCHLHGLTQAEAAARLGLPLGTVAARVSRGLDRLRDRLARRGVVFTMAGAGGLFENVGSAAPVSLIPHTAGLGTGATAPTPAVARLTAGVLAAMTRTRTAALCLVASIVAAGGVTLAFGLPTAAPPDQPKPVAPPTAVAQKPEPKPADYFQRKAALERMADVIKGWHKYANANNSILPADITDGNGRPLLSWRVAVLPTLGEEYLYAQFKLDEPWDGPNNKKLLNFVPRVFRSTPDATARGETLVKAFSGPGAATEPGKKVRFPASFPDGLSNTIGVVEAGSPVPWTKPADIPFDPKQLIPLPSGPFADGVASAFMGGDGVWLRRDISPKLLVLLIDGNDNTVMTDSWGSKPSPRPLTDEEKAEAARLKKSYDLFRKAFSKQSEERHRLTEELKKYGPDLFPDLPNVDTPHNPDDLQKAFKSVQDLKDLFFTDQKEIKRLESELEKRKKTQKK